MPRLLIVKTSSLGDVVHNLPVVTDIRALRPDWIVDWAVEESFAEIPALHPGVNRVIPVALRRWRRSWLAGETRHEMAACRALLRQHRYDMVLDTQGLLKSAWVASWAEGERHGQDWASAREPLASLFYRHRHAVARGQHAVARNRALAAAAFGYTLPSTPPDYGISADLARLPAHLPLHYVVGLHGTSRDSKLWPEGHWISLGRQLATAGRALLLPWGGDAEHARAQRIAAAVPDAMVLPRLGLAELAAVLAQGMAAVGVDTGLIHLAAALGVPTVAVYTDTDPRLTGVFGPDAQFYRNLGGVAQVPPPAEVVAALAAVAR